MLKLKTHSGFHDLFLNFTMGRSYFRENLIQSRAERGVKFMKILDLSNIKLYIYLGYTISFVI
jgi:hypothetical protein